MLTEEIRLKEAVDYVRKNYFPKWDRAQAWIFKCDPDHPKVEFAEGHCDKETKTIYLKSLPDNDIELYELIIHEICHDFDPYHGKKWQKRMLKAAQKATKTGDSELSAKIIKQVDDYRNIEKSPKIIAQVIYAEIEQTVYYTKGKASFEGIRRLLARSYTYEFLDGYKNLRRLYDKAIKNYIE